MREPLCAASFDTAIATILVMSGDCCHNLLSLQMSQLGLETNSRTKWPKHIFIFPLINTIQCPFCKCKAISHMETDYQEANAVFLHHVHSRRNYEAVTLIQACVITISQFFFSQPNDLRIWDRWRNKFGLIGEYFKQKLWIHIRSRDASLFWA